MSDPGASRIRARAQAIASVAAKLLPTVGLTEADRFTLKVSTELLAEALRALPQKLTATQVAHLAAPAKELIAADDTLAAEPTPVQISEWGRALEPAVREFLRSVHDLPHR